MQNACPTCGQPLAFSQQDGRWYCYNCQTPQVNVGKEEASMTPQLCPNCGADMQGKQFCGSCGSQVSTPPPPQQTAYPPYAAPRAPGPSSPQDIVPMYYALSLFASIVGGILLLTTEFGGSYNSTGYTETYVNIGPYPETPGAFLALLGAACAIFFCGFISLKGIQSKGTIPRNLVKLAFILAIVILVIVIIGAIALFGFTADNERTWLDAGFYGGAIGSFLIVICLGMALKNTPQTVPQRRYGYGAPIPPPGPSAPYPQASGPTPAPAMTQPVQQPSPAPQPAQAPAAQAPAPAVTQPEPAPVAQEQPQTQQPPQQQPQQPQQQPQQPYQQPAQQPQQQYQQPQQPVQQPQQQYQQPYPQQQQQPQYQTPASYPCPKCGQMLRFVNEYKKWYCYTCRKYL